MKKVARWLNRPIVKGVFIPINPAHPGESILRLYLTNKSRDGKMAARRKVKQMLEQQRTVCKSS